MVRPIWVQSVVLGVLFATVKGAVEHPAVDRSKERSRECHRIHWETVEEDLHRSLRQVIEKHAREDIQKI